MTVGPRKGGVTSASGKEPDVAATPLGATREAGEHELALGVDEYASVLARVLDHSEEEVCMAVFGQWGRGKTFLMRRVERVLGGQASVKPTHAYTTLWFNAWKYRTGVETWAHLYETFAQGAGGSGPVAKTARVLRANLALRGPWPMFFVLVALAFAMIPLTVRLEAGWTVASTLASALSWAGAVWAGLAAHRTARVAARLWKMYGGLSGHVGTLGLQAAIGDDLRALLLGWIPPSGRCRRLPIIPGLGGTLFIAAVGYSLHSMAEPWVCWLVVAALVATLIAMAALVAFGGTTHHRIVLIVDDLDRLNAEDMLMVIESIRLLLDDEEIAARVQVVMLVEEEILGEVVGLRYRDAADNPDSPTRGFHAERRVRDYIEKLFLGYLRLPPLSAEQVDELAQKKFRAEPPDPRETAGGGATDEPPHQKRPASELRAPPTQTADLQSADYDALKLGLKEETVNPGLVSPRSLRAYQFRYQVAVALLQHDDPRTTRSAIAQALAKNLFSAEPPAADPTVRLVGWLSQGDRSVGSSPGASGPGSPTGP